MPKKREKSQYDLYQTAPVFKINLRNVVKHTFVGIGRRRTPMLMRGATIAVTRDFATRSNNLRSSLFREGVYSYLRTCF